MVSFVGFGMSLVVEEVPVTHSQLGEFTNLRGEVVINNQIVDHTVNICK